MTIENLTTPASMDQNSLKLGRFPDFKIKNAAIREGRTASRGLMEIIVCTLHQPFIKLISSTFTVDLFLKRDMIMARPTAASAAATVMIINTNT